LIIRLCDSGFLKISKILTVFACELLTYAPKSLLEEYTKSYIIDSDKTKNLKGMFLREKIGFKSICNEIYLFQTFK